MISVFAQLNFCEVGGIGGCSYLRSQILQKYLLGKLGETEYFRPKGHDGATKF